MRFAVQMPRRLQLAVRPQRDLRYPACRANRAHSATRRPPMPRPRAAGSTISSRSLATSPLLHQEDRADVAPSRSAIQQRSRAGSKCSTKAPTMTRRAPRNALYPYPGVDRAVPLHHPAHVAGRRRPQDVRTRAGAAHREAFQWSAPRRRAAADRPRSDDAAACRPPPAILRRACRSPARPLAVSSRWR